MTSPTPQRRNTAIPWLLAACLPLFGWWTYGLFDLDEGFYAAVVAEMNRRGEWITPYYNGHPWFEKPILLYWIAKPCLGLFGEMVGPRLPSVFATVLTIILLYAFLGRRVGANAGLWGAIAYGGSLLVAATGRMMLTDPLLVLFLTCALTCFWESVSPSAKRREGIEGRGNSDTSSAQRASPPAPSPRSREGDRWRVLAAACLGLAVLAKGPVAAILFALIVGIAYWRLPHLRPAYRGGWLAGTLVFLLVVGSWYVPAYLENGDVFVQKFLIEQNVGRFTGGDQAHSIGLAGLLIYPIVLLVGMLPWSIWSFRAFFRYERSDPSPDPLGIYLRIWFWVVFVFFTLSGAKLPHYILPAVPPLAMLAAQRLSAQPPRWSALIPIALVWLIAQGGFSLYYYGGFGIPGFHAEVHRLARFVRIHARPTDTVALYQLGRREKSLGTGKPKIQETSHPSLMLYLDRDTLDTDDLTAILNARRPVWVITRWNRISDREAAKDGLQSVRTPFTQDLYRLYRLPWPPFPRATRTGVANLAEDGSKRPREAATPDRPS